ncbi:hypothetical protein ACLI1A_07495 [Flavobacterium sp. RHBU_3]|uniref:hypothetical protein n=1 Tax=Flavobacterium sp. RHBU_3 TaxID=3391184 RepID=UPI0039854D97
MELRTIETLLEKYFNAETSLAEEQQLKEYFASNRVAPQLEHYRPMFGYYRAQQSTETFTRTLPLKQNKAVYYKWFSVAASVVLLAGLVTFYSAVNQSAPIQQDLGTYNDPEVAFRETQKALGMLSVHVNKGVESVQYIGEYEKTRKSVFKQ